MSALTIASGLEPDWSKIALADTEHGRGELYIGAEVPGVQDFKIGPYQVAAISEPYETEKYIDVIDAAKKAGFSVLIIDSLSHAWAGQGGLLERMEPAGDCLVRVVISGAEFLVDDSLQEKLATLVGQHMTICHVFGKWGCGAMPA
jgi:hypothetical protein